MGSGEKSTGPLKSSSQLHYVYFAHGDPEQDVSTPLILHSRSRSMFRIEVKKLENIDRHYRLSITQLRQKSIAYYFKYIRRIHIIYIIIIQSHVM